MQPYITTFAVCVGGGLSLLRAQEPSLVSTMMGKAAVASPLGDLDWDPSLKHRPRAAGNGQSRGGSTAATVAPATPGSIPGRGSAPAAPAEPRFIIVPGRRKTDVTLGRPRSQALLQAQLPPDLLGRDAAAVVVQDQGFRHRNTDVTVLNGQGSAPPDTRDLNERERRRLKRIAEAKDAALGLVDAQGTSSVAFRKKTPFHATRSSSVGSLSREMLERELLGHGRSSVSGSQMSRVLEDDCTSSAGLSTRSGCTQRSSRSRVHTAASTVSRASM